MKSLRIESEFDGLALEAAVIEPEGEPRGIVAFSHGMCEHKERYFDFMEFLASAGYLCVIHDHRGHGGSVKVPGEFGNFYTEDIAGIVGDLHTVIKTVKADYPELPVFLFSHSMGTLVARCYLKKYDAEIDKLVLCGPPTRNAAAGLGLFLSKTMNLFMKKQAPNKPMTAIALGGFDKKFDRSESWLSVNPDNAKAYAEDPMCGFCFTTNGFINLMKMQKGAFEAKDWNVENPALPVFVIAGSDDPVIQSKKMFRDLVAFLKETGYQKVYFRLYEGLRHEILNEKENIKVYRDVLSFFNR